MWVCRRRRQMCIVYRQLLRPFLPQMILFLLFLTAFRIGAKATLEGLRNSLGALKVALIFQLVLPLMALAVFIPLGLSDTTFAIVIVLMLAAPSVTATPNITLLLGHDPEPAFRLLIVGTAILPLTIIPIFWLSSGLGHLADAVAAAIKLLVAIWCVVLLSFALRRVTFPTLNTRYSDALDGFTSLVLAIVVIGLMSAVGTAPASYTHRRAHEAVLELVCRLLLELKNIFLIMPENTNTHCYYTYRE